MSNETFVETVDQDGPQGFVPIDDEAVGGDPGKAEKISIGGKEYTVSQAAELVSKGEDYTRKTQALSSEKEEIERYKQELEEYRGVRDGLAAAPEFTVRRIAELAGVDLQQLAGTPRDERGRFAKSSINPDELSDEGRMLHSAFSSENSDLRAQNDELRGYIKQLGGQLEQASKFGREVMQNQSTSQASELLKQQFGVEITSTELRHLASKHGVDDPIAAWKLENFDLVQKGAFKSGVQKEREVKADLMSSGGKKVVPLSEWRDKKNEWPAERMKKYEDAGYDFEVEDPFRK